MSDKLDSRVRDYLASDGVYLGSELEITPDKGLDSPLHNLFSYTLRQREYPSGVAFEGDLRQGFLLGRELILVPKIYGGDDNLPPETKVERLEEFFGENRSWFRCTSDTRTPQKVRFSETIKCLEFDAAEKLGYWYPDTC